MAVQRVRRVIRKFDPWTVLKATLVLDSIISFLFLLLPLLVGTENGITLEGAVYLRIVVLLAVVGTIGMTGFFALGAVVYNLITDLVGGIEVIVLEETTGPIVSRPRVPLPSGGRRGNAPGRSI